MPTTRTPRPDSRYELPSYLYLTPVHFTLTDGTSNAALIISTNDPRAVELLPLPEALYASENGRLGLFGSNIQTLDCRALSSEWLQAAAATDEYEAQAVVCIVRETIPHQPDEPSGWNPEAPALTAPPSWAADVLAGRYRIAKRSVPLTIGGLAPFPAFRIPTTVEAWATVLHDPH